MDVLSGAAAVAAGASAAVRERRILVALLLLALAVRVATLGAYPLMDNTEARYAEIARKIVETGDWLMPQFKYGVPFWSKPPLSMWITAATYLVLGVSEFAARFASLVPSLGVAWLTYAMAARWRDKDTGLRAAVVLATTPLYFVSAGAVMTDPALVLGTTLSMAGFWHAMTVEGRAARAWGYAFFAGLAIGLLAKGPVGVVLTLAPVGAWAVWQRRVADAWRRLPWITGLAFTIAIALPWYVLAERRTPGFLEYFIVGEHWKRFTESGWKGDLFGTAHSRPRGTIWLFAIAFTLPWCVTWLAMRGRARGAAAAREGDGFRAYLWLWMLWPAVFFTAAGNILFTYVLPGVPAFALLVADAWRRCGSDAWTRRSTASAALAMPILMLVAVAFVLPRVGVERSHKALVAHYLAKRASEAERLVYVNEAPQSAEFYARGNVVTVAGVADAGRYLADAPRDFFALTEQQANELRASAPSRLAPVGQFGRYTLFAER